MVGVSSGQQVHWRCAAGHTWTETVAQRTANAQWKNGDPAACRVCNGYWIKVEFSCGHAALVTQMRALPERLCPDCWSSEKSRRDAAFLARQLEGKERAAEVKDACREDAHTIAEVLWEERQLERLPEILHRRARAELVSKLTFSLIGERAYGNSPHPDLAALLDGLEQISEGRFDVEVKRPLELFRKPLLGAIARAARFAPGRRGTRDRGLARRVGPRRAAP
jgi:hypothetical protein